MVETHPSLCRICSNACGVLVDVVDGRVVSVRGDDDSPVHRGYTCVKGRQHAEMYDHPERLLRPLKRSPDGSLAPIHLDRALDEIAARLRTILDRYGPRAIAMFKGTCFFYDSPVNLSMGDAFMRALGSEMAFDTVTIDQPGKYTARAMCGTWLTPGIPLDDIEVALLVGANPQVSHMGFYGNPGDLFRQIAARSGSLIVVDPRRTDAAKRATIHLQARPGEDVAVLAGMIRVILSEGLADKAFIADDVDGVERLGAAVDPFVPSMVASRADIDPDLLVRAAREFARSRRGYAWAGTGANMSGEGTLIEYLILCLDILTGHVLRAGETIRNPMSLAPAFGQPAKAQAFPPMPTVDSPALRVRGLRRSAAGMPTAALAEEILMPGPGQVRALISLGGNPVAGWPDQLLTIQALRSLELLVQADVQLTATARLADYVLPPRLAFEMPGSTMLGDYGSVMPGLGYPFAYAQYAEAIVDPPEGSQVIALWEVLFRLAQRLDLQLELCPGPGSLLPGGLPVALDMSRVPHTEELFDVVHAGSRIPLEEVRRYPHGARFPEPVVVVAAKDPGWEGRLDVGNRALMADLAGVARGRDDDDMAFPFRLISRRVMHVNNTPLFVRPANRPTYNPAHMHPGDLADLGVVDGDEVDIASARAVVTAVVRADSTVRRGTVSMSHCHGDLPELDGELRRIGSSTARLVTIDQGVDPYSGQPRMSAVPIRVTPRRTAAAGG